MKLPKKFGRYAVCILLVAAFFLVFEARLFQWQILEGEDYEQVSLENRTDTIELQATRGQILDRNGNILAGNKIGYNIVYNALNMVSSQRNATIIKVLDLLQEQGESWRDRLPILLDGDGNYQFDEENEDRIASLKEMLDLADYASADECMSELAEMFDCKGYSKEDTRNVASVRYSMYQDGFSRTNPYVIAEDVSSQTVGIVSQRADELKGIEARVTVTRYYGDDGTLAPHVVGHMGAVTQAQYDAAVENGTAYDSTENISGYKWTDTRGQAGLEAAFEEDLRGSRGLETIFTDDTGAVKSTAVTTEPKEGNTVYTTLDSDLQRAANISLKKNIEGNTQARDCIAGAAVVLDVKDFGVLACSSYPTFDMNLYLADDDYNRQVSDENNKDKPVFNRALEGSFVPGSIFKPMVALAALQEGVISADTTYFCEGEFVYGDDPDTALTLGCLSNQGPQNVYTALAQSCNVFFCNVGINLTIKKMDAYAEYFGLGEETGVELSEATGIMSNPQEYEMNHGEPWLDGASAQTAIGQADNMFTPIQLATYCATMANGGKRLQTHFLQKVTDYAGEELIREYQPVEVTDAGISSDVSNVVKQGMMSVASSGTASGIFSDYPVAVACKTGTAETSSNPDAGGTQANISFICYAPAEDPQIAVAVMLEYGNKGDYAQRVAKDILDQYFGFYTWDEDGNRYNQNGDMVDDEGEVLKTREDLDKEREQQEEEENQQFLSSALEGGSDPVSSQPQQDGEPAASSSQSSRDDIPATPFTGNSQSSPVSSAPESGLSSSAESQPEKDSPYYSGSSSEPDSS